MLYDEKSLLDPEYCYIVAEIGQAHDGSLGNAHAYIDAVAQTGVDAIKFQTHFADFESTKADEFRVKFSRKDKTRFDYWKRIEFSDMEWRELASHAEDVGLDFISTAFSEYAVDLLGSIGVDCFKVGSGDLNSWALLDKMCAYKKPIILSCGMSSLDEAANAVEFVQNAGCDAILLQCTTSYPCPPSKWGLNVIDELKTKVDCQVGYSDHSGTIFSGLAAVTMGISVLEVHTVFSKHCFGPDTPASLTIDELSTLVQGIRLIEEAKGSPVDKDKLVTELGDVRKLFSRSAVFLRDMDVGEKFTLDMVAFKKPGGGLTSMEVKAFLNCKLVRPAKMDELINASYFQKK